MREQAATLLANIVKNSSSKVNEVIIDFNKHVYVHDVYFVDGLVTNPAWA